MDYESSSSDLEIDWDALYPRRHYIHVQFADKDIAKRLGASFDYDLKSWCFDDSSSDDEKAALIRKFGKAVDRDTFIKLRNVVHYINVLYPEKEIAKTYGCRFDKIKRKWYFTCDFSTSIIETILSTFRLCKEVPIINRDNI